MNFQADHITRMMLMKQASQPPQTPQQQQQQTFAAAAQAAKGPWSIPAPQTIDPVQPQQQDGNGAEAELDKMRKELDAAKQKADKANLEVDKLRAQADMNRQHQQNLDKLKAEQEKLRALQQNRSANDEAEKARIAQHMADKKVELAEYKAQAMADIAQRNADQYVKTTDDAKKNADEYFRSQWDAIDKQREAVEQQRNEVQNKRYGLNSTVLGSIQGATKAVSGLSKVRNKMQAMPGVSLGEAMYANKAASTADQYNEWIAEQNRNSAEQEAMALRNQDGQLTDQAVSKAHIENMLERARMEGADDATIAGYRTALNASEDDFRNAKAQNAIDISNGDKDAQRKAWQLGDMEYQRGGVSELDKIRHAYRDAETERDLNQNSFWRNNMVGRALKWTGDALIGDSVGMMTDSFRDWSQARDAARRRGIDMNYFSSKADPNDTARQDFNDAMRARNINATVGGNLASTAGSAGLAALDTVGTASMLVPGVGTAAGMGIKAVTAAGKAAKGAVMANKVVNGARAVAQTGRAATSAAGHSATSALGRATSRIGSSAYDARKAATGVMDRPAGGYVGGTMKELGRHNMFGTNFVAQPGSWMNTVNKYTRPVSQALGSKPVMGAFGADLGISTFSGRERGQGMSTYNAPQEMQAHQDIARAGWQNYSSGFGSYGNGTNGFSAASASMGTSPGLGSQWMQSIGKQASAGQANGGIYGPVRQQPRASATTAMWRNNAYTDESPAGYNRLYGPGATGWTRKIVDTAGPFLQSLTGGLISPFPHTTQGLYRNELSDNAKLDQISAVANATTPEGLAANPVFRRKDPDGLTPSGRLMSDTFRSVRGTGLGYGGFNMPGKTYGAR